MNALIVRPGYDPRLRFHGDAVEAQRALGAWREHRRLGMPDPLAAQMAFHRMPPIAGGGYELKSGVDATLATVDPTSKALRVSLYQPDGTVLCKQQATYGFVARASAAAGGGLSATLTANTTKQYVSIYHTSGATKLLKLRELWGMVQSNSVASILTIEVYRLTSATTPATGNPAITPQQYLASDSAAEATVLGLPTTAGTLGQAYAGVTVSLGVTTAPTAMSSNMPLPFLLYLDRPLGERREITLRAAVAEGIGINILSSGVNSVVVATFWGVFTEE